MLLDAIWLRFCGHLRLTNGPFCSSNLEVITTCSPHNFDLVKGRGADHVFDFNSPSLVTDIRNASKEKLRHAFDCISTEATARVCAESLGPSGGKYSSLIHVEKLPREDVENSLTVAYTALGEDFTFGPDKFAASQDDFDFMVQFQSLSSKLLDQGKIKPHPHHMKSGGLESILQGLQELRERKVSGGKLVYQIK
jgi:NADPH:quinone reductase-like Zn-dependent oxidoreductase